jgi:P4 family phage/plasmid primase-like protien
MCAPAEKGKNPLDARTGGVGSPTDSSHWDTYEVAMATAQREGLLLGVALGPVPGTDYALVAVDLDAASFEGKLRDFAKKVIDLTKDWFYEVSRSLKGLHGYALVPQEVAAKFDARKIKREGYGLEFYPRERYFIWTEKAPQNKGEVIGGDELPLIEAEERFKELMAVYDEFEAIREDIYLAALQRQGLVLGKGKKGRINITCPWADQHSAKGDDTETTYWPADGKPPGFKCQHAHCEKKHMRELIEWLKKKDSRFVDDITELGKARRMQGIAGPEFYEAMIGQMFVKDYGTDYRFNHERNGWAAWSKTHWEEEKLKVVVEIMKKIATQHPPSKGGTKASHVFNAERLLRSDNGLATANLHYDSNLDLFNHLGGTLNTRTGESLPHTREDYITKIAAAKPEGDCPLWSEWLATMMAGDADMVAYLQRLCGYCLSGETNERAFFYLHGEGGNGKTVFLETMAEIMGNYAKSVSPEVFMVNRHEQHPTGLADLLAVRFAFTSELAPNQTWNAPLIKRLSGGDTIKARRMREDFWDFKPQLKLLIAGNHKPNVRGYDKAFMERMHLIPFTVSIPKDQRDRGLKRKLLRERDGIMNWCVQGLRDWLRIGLAAPANVSAATEAYFEEQDTLGNWMRDECEVDKSAEEGASDLYRSFRQWCERGGEFVISQKHFGMQMIDRGFKMRKSHGKIVYQGLRLRGEQADGNSAGGSTAKGYYGGAFE